MENMGKESMRMTGLERKEGDVMRMRRRDAELRQCNLQLLGQNMDQEHEGEGEGEGEGENDEEGGYKKGMWVPLQCCLLPQLYVPHPCVPQPHAPLPLPYSPSTCSQAYGISRFWDSGEIRVP